MILSLVRVHFRDFSITNRLGDEYHECNYHQTVCTV